MSFHPKAAAQAKQSAVDAERARCLAIVEAARKDCHDAGNIQAAMELRRVAAKIRNDKRPD